MSNQHRQRGFTLIEMMISMFLGLIILGGTITAYQAISSVSEQRDNYYKLQDELMYIHRALASSVKVAKGIEVSDEGSRLTLTSFNSTVSDEIKKITCPGAGPDQNGQSSSGSVSYYADGADFLCQPGDGAKSKKIVKLSSEKVAGIESVRFCRVLDKGEKGCKTGSDLDGVIVDIDYYDRSCDPDDEDCDSKTLSFHLATRDLTGAP
ncbi:MULTISPECIES: PilW family protein [Chromohalobacter]|uniref:Prepilin-type N-terminal cleavage/methylation domain-containing protein n=1 Tax=Chromohalobacter moromii TaxID=2860329 RepID=A0A9X3AYL3_9GAMM|nr:MULTISPECIES: prepilin-type N-terminal cleavage/methylation domain-containing protein [Chromohalobacter]MCK2047269.1 prepilin-type N-terminal cleavage/methylation domain-containing protein [Chromohalobacter moromii]MCT8470084.1 prepilin-type N-terminal cleavage/methylation domain-containing protein [Chromohalobacter canadensis]MCT8473139.1 prepilin-type N-terminal cleavage/methylation domain-containing protein [Chromohalobacter canadensis]MCT8500527.1 prepilin-type N-terminal cleavage/methyl